MAGELIATEGWISAGSFDLFLLSYEVITNELIGTFG